VAIQPLKKGVNVHDLKPVKAWLNGVEIAGKTVQVLLRI